MKFSGWKTYAAGAALIILGAVQIVSDDKESGIQNIILGIGVISGRQAIANK